MTVDSEALLSGFLRNHSTVQQLCGGRVYTDLPHERTYPLLTLQRTGGGYVINRPQWLDRAEITLSAYGVTRAEASGLLRTALHAIAGSMIGEHGQGYVTKTTVDEQLYDPDPESADSAGHARPRFTATVSLYVHP